MLDSGENLVSVYHVPPGRLPQTPDNELSAVVAIGPGGNRLLLTGDLEGAAQALLRDRPTERWSAILSPHHGSRAANTPALRLGSARPRDRQPGCASFG